MSRIVPVAWYGVCKQGVASSSLASSTRQNLDQQTRCPGLHQVQLASHPPKLAYSVPEAMAALALGRNTIYDLITSGRLHLIKVGGRRIIPASALHELLGGSAARWILRSKACTPYSAGTPAPQGLSRKSAVRRLRPQRCAGAPAPERLRTLKGQFCVSRGHGLLKPAPDA